MRIWILIILGTCFLTSCDKEDENIYVVPEFEPNQSEFTNEELLNATYSSFKIPNGFYSENLGDTSLYYVNTVSIDSSNQWIELSTANSNQALDWSERSTYEGSQFNPGTQSEKFYEFVRYDNPRDNIIIKFRTHNEAYFSREGFDFFNRTGPIGIFNKEGFNADHAKELIDYLWFTHEYNNGSAKVLSSYAESTITSIRVIHYELFIGYGDFGLNDEITLNKNAFEIQLTNGQITKSTQLIRTISGERN
ncbi:MAG: hypothetical protein HRT61_16505 [Ekhidna sp.]|nr:hypothetical protein [Ekhidna sp.]